MCFRFNSMLSVQLLGYVTTIFSRVECIIFVVCVAISIYNNFLQIFIGLEQHSVP